MLLSKFQRKVTYVDQWYVLLHWSKTDLQTDRLVEDILTYICHWTVSKPQMLKEEPHVEREANLDNNLDNKLSYQLFL